MVSQLEHFVDAGDALFASDLAVVEVSRTIRSRLDAEDPAVVAESVETSLAGIQESPISDPVINIARRLGPSSLRSLDAIHLATATLVGAEVVCAYDGRLLTAAAELGFRTISPGTRSRDIE